MKKLAWVLPLFLALVFVPLWVIAQQETPKQAAPDSGTEQAQPGTSADHQQMMQRCREMMGKHEQYKEDWKALDARLDEKLTAMNAAKGDAKMAAMAAVINEMATQRKEMREKKAAMHQAGMCGMMMGHEGGMGGMKGHGGGAMMDKHHGDKHGAHGGGGT